jgi:thioesterase domain-containing protein/acyl carrier protein
MLETQVLAQFADQLARADVTLDDDFFGLGGDSLAAMRLLSRVNERFGVELPPDAMFRWPTPRLLARAVSDAASDRPIVSSGSLVPLTVEHRRSGVGDPVYLIHGTFADPWVFRPLVEAARLQRPVYAMRAPDLDWERDVLSMRELADHYAVEIRRVQKRGPYALVGYSFGGQLAFEMAHRLRRDGQDVNPLVMLDTRGPMTIVERLRTKERVLTTLLRLACRSESLAAPALDWLQCRSPLRRAFFCLGTGPLTARELRTIVRAAFPAYAAGTDLSALTFHELCAAIVDQFRRVLSDADWAQLTSHALPDDPVALLKAHKVWAKNHWLSMSYRPRGVHPGTITIYACAGNTRVAAWQRFSAKPLDVRRVPASRAGKGAHAAFLDAAANALVARDLQRLLEAQPRGAQAVAS